MRDCDARAWSFTRLLVRQTSESTRDQSLTAATSTWRSCPSFVSRAFRETTPASRRGRDEGKLSGKSKRLRVGASNVFADEVTGEADALRGARLARAHLKHLKAQFTRTRMPRTTPRAHRASRTHTASRGDDARRRGFLPPGLALFSLLLCSSPRFARGELGAEGHDLSNFQGKHACGAKLRMSAPETVADVARVVAAFPKVRAVGVGHSWNTQLFCAGDASDAADVVVSKVRAVGRSVTGEPRSDHSANAGAGLDHSRSLLGGDRLIGGSSDRRDSRFVADAAAMEVSADAGATVRELLDFLRDFSPGESDDVGDVGDVADAEDTPSPSKSALDVFRRLRRSTTRGFDDDGDENTHPGYTLAAFPWFIDQTVGGAAATATHGSSLRHGSLSSQVVAVSVVLANGTVAEFRESVTPKHVFDAARASLGRLGATVRVTLKMKKNHPVRKTSRRTSPEAFASSVAKASDAFAACVDALDVRLNEDAYREKRKACALSSPHLRRLDETQAFWFFPLGTLTEVTFARLDDLEDDVRETFDVENETFGNARLARYESRDTNRGAPLFVVPPADVSVAASVVAATRAPHANSVAALERRGVVRDQPRDAPRDVTTVRPALANDTFARFWSRQWERSTLENVASGVFPARDSYLTMTEAQYDAHDHFAYDQYEACVPMRRAGACLRALARGARDGATGDVGGDAFGFRSQDLIRFINEEDALVSPANGRAAGACMYVNVEDFVKYNRLTTTEKDELPQKNEPFLRVVRLLRSETCRGRLHWGKAGWLESGDDRNDRNGTCFDGPSEYGESWCAFTCAAYRYDPGDKFVPAGSVFDPDRNAKFDREKCCGAGGEYLREEPGCACAARGTEEGSCGAAWY